MRTVDHKRRRHVHGIASCEIDLPARSEQSLRYGVPDRARTPKDHSPRQVSTPVVNRLAQMR